jgi:glutaredoxin
MKLPIACVVSMLLATAGPAVADMYKWVDETGKIHYTDSPPPGKKAQKLDLKINSIAGPPVVSAFKDGAAGTSNQSAAKVKVYGATWCGYCKRAKAYLQAVRGYRRRTFRPGQVRIPGSRRARCSRHSGRRSAHGRLPPGNTRQSAEEGRLVRGRNRGGWIRRERPKGPPVTVAKRLPRTCRLSPHVNELFFSPPPPPPPGAHARSRHPVAPSS